MTERRASTMESFRKIMSGGYKDITSTTSGGFTQLLFKWKGSLYKIIHFELLVFMIFYYLVTILYYFIFNSDQKRVFEQIAFYCDVYMKYIPLSFILGFYLSFVVTRWWEQYDAIPWPDTILHGISLYVQGNDESGRIMRRAMVRYLNLSFVLVLRSISSAVKVRFPTMEHLIEAGFMTSAELEIFNKIPSREFNTYWIPFTWFTHLMRQANEQKMITDACGTKLIMQDFFDFCEKCGLLWSYDWISIPLVYTQVVTIATYSFFMAALVGRQFVERSDIASRNNLVNLYIPVFTILQFLFYMGLLKVAEQLINPFGDDEEDFDLNWIIDRHTRVSYLIVDTLNTSSPPIMKDIFYDEECPELPYTEASTGFKRKTYRGSVADMVVPENKQTMVLPNLHEEDKHQANINSVMVSMYKTKMGMSKHQRRGNDQDKGARKSYGSSSLAEYNNEYLEDIINKDFAFIHLPFQQIFRNVEESKSKHNIANRGYDWIPMPSSLRARLALNRTPPDIKWRPYKRPGGPRGKTVRFKDSTSSGLSAGEFEEESAFMWRTISEETSLSDLPNVTTSDKIIEDSTSDRPVRKMSTTLAPRVVKKSDK